MPPNARKRKRAESVALAEDDIELLSTSFVGLLPYRQLTFSFSLLVNHLGASR